MFIMCNGKHSRIIEASQVLIEKGIFCKRVEKEVIDIQTADVRVKSRIDDFGYIVGRYSIEKGHQVMEEICAAIEEGKPIYRMPESEYGY